MHQTNLLPEDRYWFFRQCHAATIAPVPDAPVGTSYLVAYFAGSFEKHPDTAIWLSRFEDNDWLPPVKVAKVSDATGQEVAHWNPVLFYPGDDELILFFKVGATIGSWQTYQCRSHDGGRTWGTPTELVPDDHSGGRGPVKNKPIVLSDGTWLAPGSVETPTNWRAFAERSSDHGRTWTRSNLIGFADPSLPGKGVIQPSVWESELGQVHMVLRSTCGRVCRSDSSDGGRTWSDAVPLDLPNPNSALDLARTEDGRLFLVCNPTEMTADGGLCGQRSPLTVFASTDNGSTWKRCVDLEDEDVQVGHLYRLDGGEFSYPSLINHGNTLVGVYTIHRKQIGYWQATVDELLGHVR